MAKKKRKKGASSQNKQKTSPDTKKTMKSSVKFLILAGILVVVVGLFLLKNANDKPPVEPVPDSSEATASVSGQSSEQTPADNENGIPLEITSVDMEEILSHGLPVVIDFGADSCVPCKEMAPVLKKLNAEMQETAVVHFVDVWKYGEAAQDFPVRVIPTQVFIMPDGSPYVPSEGFEQENGLEFAMYTHKDTGEHIFTTHEGGLTEEQMRAILADMGVEA